MKKEKTARSKPDHQIKVGVVGSGSFATAIVKMLVENSEKVHCCVRNEYVKGAIEMRGHNPTYLTSVSFDADMLAVTTDINELVLACDVIVLATPSIYLSDTLEKLSCGCDGKIFVSAIKGIVPKANDVVAHYLRNDFGIGFRQQAVIAGPCHAEEVAMERLSYLTIAAAEDEVSEKLHTLFNSDFIKVHCSKDILGNEYSAILKNIYAVGAGNLIGKGYTVKSAIQSMNMIAEGYYAADSVYHTAREKNMNTPIIDTIYGVLYEEKNAETEYEKLTLLLN